jgi:hypothetical protein
MVGRFGDRDRNLRGIVSGDDRLGLVGSFQAVGRYRAYEMLVVGSVANKRPTSQTTALRSQGIERLQEVRIS